MENLQPKKRLSDFENLRVIVFSQVSWTKSSIFCRMTGLTLALGRIEL